MNKRFVEQVGEDFPDLLPTNLGATCFRHTTILIERLRAAGHKADYVAKSPGEGQYTPPGFTPFTIVGLDGKKYSCSGVSHDAIFFNGRQFDTLVSANEHHRPIYRKQHEPFWSFDPSDGPQIRASADWSEIPREHWRENNPPLSTVPIGGTDPIPTPAPVVSFPPRDLVGKAFAAIDARYAAGGRDQRIDPARLLMKQDQPLHVDNEGLFVWLSEYMRHYAGAGEPDPQGKHATALDATMRAIDDAWPK